MPRLPHRLAMCLFSLCATAALAAGKPSATDMLPIGMDSDLLFVLLDAKPGEQAQFEQGLERRMREIAAVPGVKRAQRLAVEEEGRGANPVSDAVLLYEIAASDQPRYNDEVAARLKDGRIGPEAGVDASKTRHILFRPLWPAVPAAKIPGTTPVPAGNGPVKQYYLVVMSDPAQPSQEDEYNRWYNLQHMPDVMRVPGFIRAQRFIRIGGDTGAARYLIVFRFASRDIAATNKEIGRRIKEKITVMSPTFGTQNAMGFMARPVGATIVQARKQQP